MKGTSVVNNHVNMTKARTQDIYEEREKKRRSRNLMVYGVSEDASNVSDQQRMATLFNALHTTAMFTQITRVGVATQEKIWPILVVLKNDNEKKEIMNSLPALKGMEEYKGINIREDLTIKERNNIEILSKEAKARNIADSYLAISGECWDRHKTGFI